MGHGRRLVLQRRPGWPVDNPATAPPTTGFPQASRTRAKGGRNGQDKTEGIVPTRPPGQARFGLRGVMTAVGGGGVCWRLTHAPGAVDDQALGHRRL